MKLLNLLQYKLDGQNIKLLLFDSINHENLYTRLHPALQFG